MSDGSFIRIRNHEVEERRRSAAQFAALVVASAVALAAFAVAMVTVARLIG
jgi:hypothetical protein